MNEKDEHHTEDNTIHEICEICKIEQHPDFEVRKPHYGDKIPIRKTYGDFDNIHAYYYEFTNGSEHIRSYYYIYNDGKVIVKHEVRDRTNQCKTKKCVCYLSLKKAEELHERYKREDAMRDEMEEIIRKYNNEHPDVVFID